VIPHRMKIVILALVLVLVPLCGRAAENSANGLKFLDDLKARLEQAYAALPQDGGQTPVAYRAEALARIEAVRAYLVKEPEAKQASDLIEACRLLTEAAILRVQTRINDHQAQELAQRREDVLRETKETFLRIDQTYQAIDRTERRQIQRLRQDLAKVQRKSAELWQEAQARFNALQGTLLQVKNEAQQTILRLADISFENSRTTLTSDSKINLARVAGILLAFRDLNVAVEGHTDNQGTLAYNQRLSEERAKSVVDYLISMGVDPARLSYAGYNFSRPVAGNDTPEGRDKNRRVDLVIQEKPKP